ncbi:MAG: rhomboid family intramembrane serine protease [Lachnospiraceae bacterium]|nr:rhomboid family intramembrane serine protease [Lachnospiraceae bacterium]
MDRLFTYFKRIPITISLVLINIVIFIILEIVGDTQDGLFMLQHGAMNPTEVLYNHQWYRLFSSMFLHFGGVHLLNNMFLLAVLGQYLEPTLGYVKFLAIYLFSGLGGSFASMIYMLMVGDNNISAGASGAIYGIVGGLLIVVLANRGRFRGFKTRSILIMLALSLYGGFTGTRTDNAAHIGGLIVGIILTFFLYGIKTIITLRKLRQYDLENGSEYIDN